MPRSLRTGGLVDDSLRGCNFYGLGGECFFAYHDDTYTVSKQTVGRCQAYIFVWRDFSRAFIGGGEFGYDWIAREMDAVEIEAIAERLNLPELREVLARRTVPPLA